jgi:putative SOS response-associated peptidase YedK
MCGRYRRTTKEEELARIYRIPIPPQRDLPISWNIAPSQDVLAIRFRPKTSQRSLDTLRWGLVPYWTKDSKIGFKTINARVETVDTAPIYREAFKKRRCLIPADSFYEWKKVPGGKIPYTIGMQDDFPFRFCRAVGGMERSIDRRMAADLLNHYRRTKRTGRPGAHQDARDPAGRTSRRMVG